MDLFAWLLLLGYVIYDWSTTRTWWLPWVFAAVTVLYAVWFFRRLCQSMARRYLQQLISQLRDQGVVPAGDDPEWIESRRTTKGVVQEKVERIYRQYAASKMPFEKIRQKEAKGFGQAILADGQQCLRRRLGLEPTPSSTGSLGLWTSNTFDILIHMLQERLEASYLQAAEKAQEFLLSDHVVCIPMADINAKLHAGLAMLCRGTSPRKPKPSDLYDIDQLACFVPYVDLMIADRFFADLCNQSHLRIGDLYGCQIRSVGPKDIPGLIEELDTLVERAPQAILADRISNAIHEGGFHQEFAERAAVYLQVHGVSVDQNAQDE